MFKRFGILPWLVLAIIFGILIGAYTPEWFIRIFATFSDIFGNFLGFVIPLIILGFIAPGIGEIGRGAGKLLGLTAAIAYASTVIAGFAAYFVTKELYPTLLKGQSFSNVDEPSSSHAAPFFEIEMEPIMDVMTALILAFIIGLGIAAINGKTMLYIMYDFKEIIELLIRKIIIPLLPVHILGIFANMTFSGEVSTILSVFFKVFILIIALHLLYLCIQYFIAGSVSKENPLSMIKTMTPAYFTALGTQSSAATIPVTLESSKKLKVKDSVADFTIPLLANIHLSGSTITLMSCAMAVLFLQGDVVTFGKVIQFVLLLGVTMIAAPGVPGGAVMAAAGLLETVLGFGPEMVTLMIALYMAQDSFGTACNVTGDGAITSITSSLSKDIGNDDPEQKHSA